MTRESGPLIEYVVDGLGRRIAKKVNGSVVKRWLWAGPLRIVAELDQNGYVSKRFVYGTKVNVPEYMTTYDPVTHAQNGTYRILTDQLGSLRLVVNVADGSIAQRMRHDEWGNVLEDSNEGFVPFGFAGGLYDPDTGLVRFGARDYDPETGRWTGKDPILFGGGDTNLFNYVLSNPQSFTDASGLDRDNWYLGDVPPNQGNPFTFITDAAGVSADFWADEFNNPNASWYWMTFSGVMGACATLADEERIGFTISVLSVAWLMRNIAGSLADGTQANTLIDLGNIFRLENHAIGKGAQHAIKWHIDALGGIIRHWRPWQ